MVPTEGEARGRGETILLFSCVGGVAYNIQHLRPLEKKATLGVPHTQAATSVCLKCWRNLSIITVAEWLHRYYPCRRVNAIRGGGGHLAHVVWLLSALLRVLSTRRSLYLLMAAIYS